MMSEIKDFVDDSNLLTISHLFFIFTIFFSFASNILQAQDNKPKWQLIDFSAELAVAVFLDPDGRLHRIRNDQVFSGESFKLKGVSNDHVLIQYHPSNTQETSPSLLFLQRGQSLPFQLRSELFLPRYKYQTEAIVVEELSLRSLDSSSDRKK